MKKRYLFYLLLMMLFSMSEISKAQVARPDYNTSTGFFVLDGKL